MTYNVPMQCVAKLSTYVSSCDYFITKLREVLNPKHLTFQSKKNNQIKKGYIL